MRRILLSSVAIGTAAVLALGAGVASAGQTWGGSYQVAQAGPGMGPGMGGGPGPGPGPGHGMMEHGQGMMGHGPHGPGGPHDHFRHMCENGEAKIAAKLAFAEVKLKLTEAQKPAWAKFADAVRAGYAPTAKACEELSGKPEEAANTLPERLERMDTIMSAHLAMLHSVRLAATDLYGQLTADQKKIADALPFHGRP